ncbi:MAG: DJ-1/PfpI family protein [Candidatus Kuenenbacteria bacterium]
MSNLSQKRILIIVAYQDYNETELEIPRDLFGMFGAEISIASSSLGTAIGKAGSSIEVDYLLSDIHPEDYDAYIFIGGMGSIEYQESEQAHRIARGAVNNDRILAAICIAPLILAKAGVLVGKRATVWTDSPDGDPVKILQDSRAVYTAQDVVVDGKIVTANGPQAARQFANAIVDLLAK